MANYTVPADDWVDIETLMDDNYDATKDYVLYINQISLGLLQLAYGDSKPTEKGMELPSFTKINITKATGDAVWVKASASPIDVYIYEA